MNDARLKFFKLCSLAVLASAVALAWYAARGASAENELTLSMFDIGQGDSIFIEAPSGVQMLVDGGPDRSVLARLGEVMSAYDHAIDVLVVTNPDKDHIAGFIDVLNAYDVSYVLEPGTVNESGVYRELERTIDERHAKRIIASRGMTVDLGSGARFQVLFPDRDVSAWSTNDGSIVGRLEYGSTTVLMTGDATARTEAILVGLDGANLRSDVLKVGHHGSRGSSSGAFLALVRPRYALVSAGRHNSYGHPHRETIERLKAIGAQVFGTYERGTITVRSDGAQVVVE